MRKAKKLLKFLLVKIINLRNFMIEECPNCNSKRIEECKRQFRYDRNPAVYYCSNCKAIWTYSYRRILHPKLIIYHEGEFK